MTGSKQAAPPMAVNSSPRDLFAGLTSLSMTEAIDLGDGIVLRPTRARFMSPFRLKNSLRLPVCLFS